MYCSKKCRKNDYKLHLNRCKELQNEKENAEPSDQEERVHHTKMQEVLFDEKMN